ncbi:MAG: hypothetical protein ACRYG2_16340, partial [Janthinobacterium lividum]
MVRQTRDVIKRPRHVHPRVPGHKNQVHGLTDRGPDVDGPDGSKFEPSPDLTPAIGKSTLQDGQAELVAEDAQDLAALALERERMLSGAPCNLLGASWGAVRRLVRAGAVGTTRVVHAELDDNP